MLHKITQQQLRYWCSSKSKHNLGGIFSVRREMIKILAGGATPPFLFPSRKNPTKLPSNNLTTDAKEIE